MSLIIFTILTSFFIKYALSDIIVYARNSGQIVEEFRDLPARFGPSLPSTGLRFIAIGAEPRHGCSKIIPPPDRNITSIKWVVLIARYNCSFDEKVRIAQSAGYDACIVYNVGSNDLEQMSTKKGDGILIPSVFVGEHTGDLLLYNYQWNNGFALIINDDLPFNINTHLIVPFSIVVGLCFIIMIGFMIVKCVRDQRRLRRHRLPSGLLKKIPTIKFGKGDTYETCAICLDDYIEGDKLRVLPCSHAYHTKCIDPWLTKNRRVCPICKRKVFARGEQRPRRRRSSSDSMSDSDVDDRTPLLNPVENSSNHGTFGGGGSTGGGGSLSSGNDQIGEGGSHQAVYPQRRINPFDRVLTVQNQTPENNNRLRWERFKSFFTRTQTESSPRTTQPDLFNSSNTVLINAIPIANPIQNNSQNVLMARTSSSNNILNKNLSGSFNKGDDDLDNNDDGNETDNNIDDNDDDDEMLTDNNNIILRNDNIQQNGLIGVIALPNNNFNHQLSTSSPNNIQQQSINNSRRSNSNPYIV